MSPVTPFVQGLISGIESRNTASKLAMLMLTDAVFSKPSAPGRVHIRNGSNARWLDANELAEMIVQSNMDAWCHATWIEVNHRRELFADGVKVADDYRDMPVGKIEHRHVEAAVIVFLEIAKKMNPVEIDGRTSFPFEQKHLFQLMRMSQRALRDLSVIGAARKKFLGRSPNKPTDSLDKPDDSAGREPPSTPPGPRRSKP